MISGLALQRQELDLTRKTLIKMNEALKGFEIRPLYIERRIMKWKKPRLNSSVFQRLTSMKASGRETLRLYNYT